MVIAGDAVELFFCEEVILEECGWEGWMRSAVGLCVKRGERVTEASDDGSK